MAGVPPVLYWLATFIWDYIIWILVTISMVAIIFLFDKNDVFNNKKEMCKFVNSVKNNCFFVECNFCFNI